MDPITASLPTPAPSPAAPTPPPAPVVTPSPAPTPSAAPSPQPASDPESQARAFMSKAQAGYDQAATDAKIPTVPPTVPHARLLNMIAGIGVALSATGTALSTHGREGGAPEIQQYYANQQQQKIQAQQAAQAQKNAKLQQDLMVADTNEKLAYNAIYMATIHNQMTQSDLDVQGKQLGVIGQGQDIRAKALNDLIAGAITPEQYQQTINQVGQVGQTPSAAGAPAPTGTAASPAAGSTPAATPSSPVAGAVPAAGTPGVPGATPSPSGTTPSAVVIPPQALNAWKNTVDAASLAYPDDPQIKQYAATFADPNSTSEQLRMAGIAAGRRMDTLKTGTEVRTAQQKSDPLFALETDPGQMEGPKASAAIPLLQNMLSTETDPARKVRETHLLAQARSAHNNFLADQRSQENARVQASEGSPDDAGRLLASGDLTLADLKSRGSTPGNIVASINAAKKYDPNYNPSDEIIGEKVIGEPGSQTFFGSARSLVQRGGMLDQLQTAHTALGSTQLPALNTLEQWTNYQAGSPELATYRAAVLNAADDAAKVMGGGTPTDALRDLFLKTFSANINNLGFNDAVAQARSGVRSQVTGRIGTNGYIQKREGDILRDEDSSSATPPPSGTTGKAKGSDGNYYYHDATGKILGPAPSGQ